MITSSSCRLSIGQPCSSKSTFTCAEIGVEVASVEMYSGDAYTAETKSSTSAKLRSAWMPPAVAQAPIVTSRCESRRICADPLGVVRGRHRALDEREVVRARHASRCSPRGSRRSRPRRRARAARPRSRGARAGSRRRTRTSRRRASASPRRSQLPHRQQRRQSVVASRRARRGRSASGRAGSGRSGRRRTSCCAPSRGGSARGATPRSRSACDGEAHHDLRARRSAPSTVAASKRAPAISFGTTPTLPRQPPSALSTVTSTWTSTRRAPALELAPCRARSPGVRRRRAAATSP